MDTFGLMSVEEIKQLSFVFIVAKGRSGTTLMQTILDANENVILPLESRLIVHLKQKYFSITEWTPALLDAFTEDLYKDKKFSRYWSVDAVKLRKSIDALPIKELTFPVLCKLIYLNYPSPFPKGRITLLGDKNPIYSVFIKELSEVFPDAKFIHLVRDYRDNIVSNKKVFQRQSVAQLAQGWKVYNIFIEQAKKGNEKNFYTLKYEDLASDPSRVVPEICDFLQIRFNPAMFDFHTKMQQVTGEKYVEEIKNVHPNLVKPINTKQINKWKETLSESDIELADFIAGDYAKQYGYVPETHRSALSFRIRALLALARIYLDFFIIRSYYKMPFGIRDAVGRFNKKLYEKFKISNYYNHADFRFKE
ncbi:MAG: sulfotransferase [Bacteroidetes bacterium]|nr:sulfotransferase [Bacteroidota bacterium]